MPNDAEQEFEFDVALSFAGEDRAYVNPIAHALRDSGVKVFYDDFQQSDIWGRDMYVFLDDVYRKRARYTVAFISRYYVEKVWPKHERESAQARALIEGSPYFLPVRLDDSELPGLRPTVNYIDARIVGRDRIIELILEKLVMSRPIDRVPRAPEEEALLLAVRPPGWEYLFFAAALKREMAALEEKWRDHRIGYVRPAGQPLDEAEARDLLQSIFREAPATVGNVERLLSPESTELAFGAAGEPGDSDQIEHLAKRVINIYGELLDWSSRVRGARVPDAFEHVFTTASRFMDLPIRQFREFVDEVVRETDAIPAALRNEEPVSLTLTLTVSIDEAVQQEFNRELDELSRWIDANY